MGKYFRVFLVLFCLFLSGCKDNQSTEPEEKVYNVIFYDYDGSVIQEIEVIENHDVVFPNDPVRDGYIFIGWNSDGKNITSDSIIVAEYEKIINEYTINFDTNGYFNVASVIVKENTNIPNPGEYEKKGYAFLGWYDGDKKWDFSVDKPVNDMTLTAKWELISYNINYENLLGATNNNPNEFNIESDTIILSIPERKNYEFLGWTYDGQNIPVMEVEIPMGTANDKTFYANWCHNGLKFELLDDGTYQLVDIEDRSIKTIRVPAYYRGKQVTKIADQVFIFCSAQTIEIEEGIKEIGINAFTGCMNLIKIKIPSSVEKIGLGSFEWCYEFKNIEVDENNQNYKSIDGVLYSKDGSTLICFPLAKGISTFTIPSTVKVIGEGAFSQSLYLKQIIIPNSVIRIEKEAFVDSWNLSNIVIPSSVEYIGKNAFTGINVKTIYCEIDSQPDAWDKNWTDADEIIWGYKK